MKQYYLLCVPGSCGMFVTSLMSHYLLGKTNTTISANGHCHDLGQGTWTNTDEVYLIGDQWQDRVYHKPILFSHYTDLARVRELMPDITVILIDYQADDVEQISRFRTVKAHHLDWTPEEHASLAGPDWPPYDPDNILHSPLIQHELTQARMPFTRSWISQVDRNQVDFVLQFKDIVAGDINRAVAGIFGFEPDPAMQDFVAQYQQVNQKI
jgi:hypothetical protein